VHTHMHNMYTHLICYSVDICVYRSAPNSWCIQLQSPLRVGLARVRIHIHRYVYKCIRHSVDLCVHRPAPNPWGIQTRGRESLSDFKGAPCISCARVRTNTRTYVYTRTPHSVAICVVICVHTCTQSEVFLRCKSAKSLSNVEARLATHVHVCTESHIHTYTCVYVTVQANMW